MNMQRLVKFVSEFSAEAYKAEPSAGYIDDTDAVMPGEPTASGGLLSSEMFAEFSLPYLQIEIKAIKSMGMSASLHICGDTTNHLPFMAQSGAKILAIEQKVNPYVGMKQVDGKVALVGDVGPVQPLMLRTIEQVVEDTLRCIDAGFQVIHPGCALPPETPTANLRAMTETTKAFSKKIAWEAR
jgi:MtaA/CmuA family methyltransferase